MDFKLENTHSHNSKIHKINSEETEKRLKTARSDCSTGDDKFPIKSIKPVALHFATPLTFIINLFIQNKNCPDMWKIARISPIPKFRTPEQFSHHRPKYLYYQIVDTDC